MSAYCGASGTPRDAAHKQEKLITVWRAAGSRWSPELWREAIEFGSEYERHGPKTNTLTCKLIYTKNTLLNYC